MELKLNIGFEQLLNLAIQLPQSEKQRLIAALQKTTKQNEDRSKMSTKGERTLGKYEGKIQMSEDFNAPLDDLKEYM